MNEQTWKIDSEGCYLCPECWQAEAEYADWPAVTVFVDLWSEDPYMYCEQCGKGPDGTTRPTEATVEAKRLAVRGVLATAAAPMDVSDQILGDFEREVRRLAAVR